MKKSMVPVAFAAAVSLAACGNGSKAGQTAISLSPSASTSHAAAPSSTSSTSPTSTSSHAAVSATSQATASATRTSTKAAAMAPSAPAHSATAHATSAPAAIAPTKAAPATSKASAVAPVTPATKVSKVWPDATWKIQTENADLCNMGMGPITGSPSGFSADTFTCGATFQTLVACKKDASGFATCIRDYPSRTAVRFKTSATISGAAPSYTMPLAAKLQNGAMCGVTAHDQSAHYGDMHGWLYCDNGGTLLLPNGDDGTTANYFNKSDSTWTAQLGMGTNAPTTVKVAQVFYAQ